MKATKLVLITALVSFALMGFANAGPTTSKNVISLKAATQNAELVAAIYSQVEPTYFFRCKCSGPHTEQVKINKTEYLVNGTFAEWRRFFNGIVKDKPGYQNDIKPGLLIDINPFGTAGHKINPFSVANPFSNEGKKTRAKKVKGPKVDKP